MRFAILGAGALGSLLAAHLHAAGHRVTLIARGERAARLRREGVRLCGLSTLEVMVPVVTDPSQVWDCEVFINTVKTWQSAAALEPFAGLRPQIALSVQNGVLKEDELRERFGAQAVVGAMADISGELNDDGTVAFTRNVALHLGEPGGGVTPRIESLVQALEASGIRAQVSADIDEVIWSKYVGWVALMLIAVLTRLPTARFLCDPDSARVIARLTREMGALALARGVRLADRSPLPVLRVLAGSEDDAVARVLEVGAVFAAQAPDHRMSSQQDVTRGRPLEVAETAGHALALARAAGLDTPTLAVCHALALAVHHAHLAG